MPEQEDKPKNGSEPQEPTESGDHVVVVTRTIYKTRKFEWPKINLSAIYAAGSVLLGAGAAWAHRDFSVFLEIVGGMGVLYAVAIAFIRAMERA